MATGSPLNFLFEGAPPSSVTTSGVASTDMPDWYQEYLRGTAGKATTIAGEPYQAYPGQRQAGFTPDQLAAFENARGGVGAWQPMYGAATEAAGNIAPAAYQALGTGADYTAQGVGATAGPAATWDTSYQKYMSPYTSQVVDEISRLGNRNLTENIIPNVQSQFTGGGQFGSSRNAEILGRSVRDAQRDISGQQSQALQAGWGQGANIFGADASRTQQQQQMQSGAALTAGQLSNAGAQIGAAASDQAAGRLGALGQLGQTLGAGDTAALGAVGGVQQQQQQAGMDTAYQEFLRQQGWDAGQLGMVSNVLTGKQMPTTTTQVSNSPSGGYQPSPLSWISALYGLNKSTQPAAPGG
jgi:hypothetical protein